MSMNQRLTLIQNRALEFFNDSSDKNENPYKVQSDLQEMMQNFVGIVRTEEELMKAKNELQNFMTEQNIQL